MGLTLKTEKSIYDSVNRVTKRIQMRNMLNYGSKPTETE